MVPVEFQARVENGIIVVPDEYKQVIANHDTVTVVVSNQPKKRISQTGLIAALTRNPVAVPGIRSITREEMHDRNL